jgi:hypothetical protein
MWSLPELASMTTEATIKTTAITACQPHIGSRSPVAPEILEMGAAQTVGVFWAGTEWIVGRQLRPLNGRA